MQNDSGSSNTNENSSEKPQDLLTIGEAADYLGVSIDTLRRWEKKGRIEPLRSPGGHRYFKKFDLDNLFGKRYTRTEATIRPTDLHYKVEERPPTLTSSPILRVEEKLSNSNNLQTNTSFEPETIEVKRIITVEQDENVSFVDSSIPIPSPSMFSPTQPAQAQTSNTNPVVPGVASMDNRETPRVPVAIPQVAQVKVISDEVRISAQEAYYRQQNANMLTPREPQTMQDIRSTSPIKQVPWKVLSTEEVFATQTISPNFTPTSQMEDVPAPRPQNTSILNPATPTPIPPAPGAQVSATTQPKPELKNEDKKKEDFSNKLLIFAGVFVLILMMIGIWYFFWTSSQRVLTSVPQ